VTTMPDKDFKLGYFDQPKTKKMLWGALWGVCVVSVVLQLFTHTESHFEQVDFFGFNALLGFTACSVCILVAKGLGLFLKKSEDYYDDAD